MFQHSYGKLGPLGDDEQEPRLAAPPIHEREEGATRRPFRPRPIWRGSPGRWSTYKVRGPAHQPSGARARKVIMSPRRSFSRTYSTVCPAVAAQHRYHPCGLQMLSAGAQPPVCFCTRCINVWTESGRLQPLEGDVVEVPPASDKSHPVKRFGSTDVSPRHRCATARHHPKSMWPQTHPSLTTDIWQNALHGRTETTDWTDMQL